VLCFLPVIAFHVHAFFLKNALLFFFGLWTASNKRQWESLPWVFQRDFKYLPVSTKKTTSGKMLCFYIIYSESLVEVDQLTVEVNGINNKSKVEVV
jgi:hypothetical protein